MDLGTKQYRVLTSINLLLVVLAAKRIQQHITYFFTFISAFITFLFGIIMDPDYSTKYAIHEATREGKSMSCLLQNTPPAHYIPSNS